MHSDYVMKNKKEEKKIYGVDEWISYIDEHITENLTAKGLAKLFHYSEKHLKNIFQLYYETRITDYIKQRKLYFAAEELKEGKNPEKYVPNINLQVIAFFLMHFAKNTALFRQSITGWNFRILHGSITLMSILQKISHQR